MMISQIQLEKGPIASGPSLVNVIRPDKVFHFLRWLGNLQSVVGGVQYPPCRKSKSNYQGQFSQTIKWEQCEIVKDHPEGILRSSPAPDWLKI